MTSQRKKYVDHTVRCSGCGDVLIEVFTPMVTGEVVIGHRAIDLDADVLKDDDNYKPAQRRARDWDYTTHVQVTDPIHGTFYSPDLVSSACRCNYSRHFGVAELLARKGKISTEQTTHRGW